MTAVKHTVPCGEGGVKRWLTRLLLGRNVSEGVLALCLLEMRLHLSWSRGEAMLRGWWEIKMKFRISMLS